MEILNNNPINYNNITFKNNNTSNNMPFGAFCANSGEVILPKGLILSFYKKNYK